MDNLDKNIVYCRIGISIAIRNSKKHDFDNREWWKKDLKRTEERLEWLLSQKEIKKFEEVLINGKVGR